MPLIVILKLLKTKDSRRCANLADMARCLWHFGRPKGVQLNQDYAPIRNVFCTSGDSVVGQLQFGCALARASRCLIAHPRLEYPVPKSSADLPNHLLAENTQVRSWQ